jgi:hypothetical protein
MSEFYMWSSRSDVCAVGHHVAAGVAKIWLINPQALAPANLGQQNLVDAIEISVCPHHMEQIRTNGFRGFVVRDEPRN